MKEQGRLVIKLKLGDSVSIGETIVRLISVQKSYLKIRIFADKSLRIHRLKLKQNLEEEDDHESSLCRL